MVEFGGHHLGLNVVIAGDHAVTASLGVQQLRLVMGTSMGCMHSFMYAETYPDGARAASLKKIDGERPAGGDKRRASQAHHGGHRLARNARWLGDRRGQRWT